MVPGERAASGFSAAAPDQPDLNIGDDAVHKGTGRTWAQWFAALDAEGARTLPHSDIARLVFQRFRVNPWWSQMVTVGYEQAHGLREKHEKADGYSISASKTLAAPAERVYAAWNVDAERGRWLGMNLKVRSATPPKSIRLNWSDPISQIVVMLNPRGAGKTQVAVEHNRLKDRAECDRMRTFWASALERLGVAVGGR
ncbi:MAG: SRPBCC domain-containing protein [SAR324 cluster bacterium]